MTQLSRKISEPKVALPAPKMIYRTIKQVFPTCRIFREMPPDVEAIKEKGMDFTNKVFVWTQWLKTMSAGRRMVRTTTRRICET
jgi:hypothetical protein